MATIYEITGDIIAMLGTAEEVPDEIWESQSGQAMIEKVDSYCHVKVNIDAAITAHEREIDRLQQRLRALKRNRSNMLNRLKDCLEALDIKKIQTNDKLFTVHIVKNPSRVVIDDPEKVPPDCITIIPEEYRTDKIKLKSYIVAGRDVGAHLENDTRLEIR